MNEKELMAFYNVENLFDIYDDPNTFDDEFTPKGKRKWTEKKYENKIYKISRAIKELSEFNDVFPFLIGLAEIENQRVLEDLQAQLPSYKSVHYDSKDERGIDVALLYNPKQFFVTHSEPIYVDLSIVDPVLDYTRDILYVNGMYRNKSLHVFIAHLPSKRNQDINKDKRILALRNLEERIKKIYESEPHPAIVVMGDMNENPDKDILQDIIGYTDNPNKISGKVFYNPFYNEYKEENYSLYHKNEGMLFDQIILSPYFFSKKSELQFSESLVFDYPMLKEWKPQYRDLPFRTYVGRKYLGGYSDHFPVYCVFNEKYDPIAQYIDSTYLKTEEESGLSEDETYQKVDELTQFAIDQHIKCAMIRPKWVNAMKTKAENQNAKVNIGTVIDFPLGTSSIFDKVNEAQKAMKNGADELDFVANYTAFKEKNEALIKEEFVECSRPFLQEGKIVKWIIETAALESGQIEKICKIYADLSQKHFRAYLQQIFIKSSTGYFQQNNQGYSGATPSDIKIMVEAAYPLLVKASGGIRTREEAQTYLKIGAKRLGTSSAQKIII